METKETLRVTGKTGRFMVLCILSMRLFVLGVMIALTMKNGYLVEDSRGDVAEALQDDYHKVLFLDYQPEPTDGAANAKQFKTMITKYIAGA